MGKTDPYFIEAVARALDVLELFRDREDIRLTDVVERLGMIKSTAFRFLYTLEQKGMIERSPDGRSYRRRVRHRIGMVSISHTIPFVQEVEHGIQTAARRAGLELSIRHHGMVPERLFQAVDRLLDSGIAALLCYNPNEHLSYVVADRCSRANVPVIAITFPVPGGRLFSINNYRAGLDGGDALGTRIARRWRSTIDRVVILDIPGSSPAQQARTSGMLEGLQKHVPIPSTKITHVHLDRDRNKRDPVLVHFLNQTKRSSRIAVLCYNDLNSISALSVTEQLGRSEQVAILSQGGTPEVRAAIRRPLSAMWAAVAHFPERFGEQLIPIILRTLRGEPAPAITYTNHVVLTRENIRTVYPET